jgi:hypothetical protein
MEQPNDRDFVVTRVATAIATTANVATDTFAPAPRHQECDIHEVDDVNAEVAQVEPPQMPKFKRKKRATNTRYVNIAYLSCHRCSYLYVKFV